MMKIDIISASCKGPEVDHSYQDFIRVQETDSTLVAVVADGLGSVALSARGSALICHFFAELAAKIDWRIHKIPELLHTVISEWYQSLSSKGVQPHDCCTTCSVIIVNKLENDAYLCQIGDSPILYRYDGTAVECLATEKEFLNETICLGGDDVPVFSIQKLSFKNSFDFLIASDGFGDEIILDVSDNLFDYLIDKYKKIKPRNRNGRLKKELLETMQKKNMDDKSIIFGWIR